MIPCLYGEKETAFATNGIGKLCDAFSCTVTEKRVWREKADGMKWL